MNATIRRRIACATSGLMHNQKACIHADQLAGGPEEPARRTGRNACSPPYTRRGPKRPVYATSRTLPVPQPCEHLPAGARANSRSRPILNGRSSGTCNCARDVRAYHVPVVCGCKGGGTPHSTATSRIRRPRRCSSCAFSSHPTSAMTESTYIQTTSAITAPVPPYSTL
jgi:hypothetical protein